MTLQEASSRFHIEMEALRLYVENGLLIGRETDNDEMDYREADLQRAAQLRFLLTAGMGPDAVKQLLVLMDAKTDTDAEQVRLLRRCRYRLLDEIHEKQQSLDQVDYLIREIRDRKPKGGPNR